MTQEIALYRSIDETMSLGKLLAQSGYFADSRDAAQAVVKVLAGAELGFGPIASMTGINIIKGKVTLSANLIAAAIKRSGRYNYRVRKMTDEACEIMFFEGKDEIGVSTFTMADAKAAGLNSGDNWRKFPRNMLFARAISNGAKWYCPDLSGGPLYTPDELGAQVDGETGEVIDAPRIVVEPPKPTNGAQQASGQQAQAAAVSPAKPAPAQTTNGDNLPFRDQGTAVKWAAQFAYYQKPDGSPDFGHITGSIKTVCKEHNCNERDVTCWGWPWYDRVMGHVALAADESTDELTEADIDPVTAGDWIDK